MIEEETFLEESNTDNIGVVDFEELEMKLQNDLDSQLSGLDYLKNDHEKIGDPENLGLTIMNVVWEQFLNQIAVTAGEDFIRENQGLTLDLRSEAHIQTAENFENGKIATHNTKIDYQTRHDDWLNNFQTDDNGNIVLIDKYQTGDYQKLLKKDARKPFDNNRDKGSAAVNKDHTISVAEIMRDTKANTHVDKQELIDFANSKKNINDLDASANKSKGDRKTNDWLDSGSAGQKPADRFDIDENQLREKDRIAREQFEEIKDNGEQKSIDTGKQSKKDEAFRITGKALRAVVMQLLAELIKEVIRKLIMWLKSASKTLESLLSSIKAAISSFINNLKTHLRNAGSALITTIATAIYGPIVRTVKRVWIMLKQGWYSLKQAIDYLKNPENKNKPYERLILEVGKIVIVGVSALGAITLGEVIEKSLMSIPVFMVEIPLLGSLASLLGLFIGGLLAGIIGAIALSLIDRAIINQQTSEAIEKEIIKSNEILNTQNAIHTFNENKLENVKQSVAVSIINRHVEATEIMQNTLENIFNEDLEIVVASNGNET